MVLIVGNEDCKIPEVVQVITTSVAWTYGSFDFDKFAHQLGLQPFEIKKSKRDQLHDKVTSEEILENMLASWRNKMARRATLQTLILALSQIHHNDVAERLCTWKNLQLSIEPTNSSQPEDFSISSSSSYNYHSAPSNHFEPLNHHFSNNGMSSTNRNVPESCQQFENNRNPIFYSQGCNAHSNSTSSTSSHQHLRMAKQTSQNIFNSIEPPKSQHSNRDTICKNCKYAPEQSDMFCPEAQQCTAHIGSYQLRQFCIHNRKQALGPRPTCVTGSPNVQVHYNEPTCNCSHESFHSRNPNCNQPNCSNCSRGMSGYHFHFNIVQSESPPPAHYNANISPSTNQTFAQQNFRSNQLNSQIYPGFTVQENFSNVSVQQQQNRNHNEEAVYSTSESRSLRNLPEPRHYREQQPQFEVQRQFRNVTNNRGLGRIAVQTHLDGKNGHDNNFVNCSNMRQRSDSGCSSMNDITSFPEDNQRHAIYQEEFLPSYNFRSKKAPHQLNKNKSNEPIHPVYNHVDENASNSWGLKLISLVAVFSLLYCFLKPRT